MGTRDAWTLEGLLSGVVGCEGGLDMGMRKDRKHYLIRCQMISSQQNGLGRGRGQGKSKRVPSSKG